MFVSSQNSYDEALTHSVTVFGDGVLGRQLRLGEVRQWSAHEPEPDCADIVISYIQSSGM